MLCRHFETVEEHAAFWDSFESSQSSESGFHLIACKNFHRPDRPDRNAGDLGDRDRPDRPDRP